MVEKQKRIQDIVNQQLNRLEQYDEFKEAILDKLQEIAETLDDVALNKMVGKISLESEDEGLEQIKRAFAYICENYRVERRVVDYQKMRLDIVCEEQFTLMKEDMENNAAFFSKIDQALREANHWNRDAFDRRTMLEVRNLFEVGIDPSSEEQGCEDIPVQIDIHDHDYSRLHQWFSQPIHNGSCRSSDQYLFVQIGTAYGCFPLRI